MSAGEHRQGPKGVRWRDPDAGRDSTGRLRGAQRHPRRERSPGGDDKGVQEVQIPETLRLQAPAQPLALRALLFLRNPSTLPTAPSGAIRTTKRTARPETSRCQAPYQVV